MFRFCFPSGWLNKTFPVCSQSIKEQRFKWGLCQAPLPSILGTFLKEFFVGGV
ncbi:MAG: hypothetical protein IJU92_02905 [Spirochaetaceae bacterium]|nr:hypothetical protein [Spirochaetaceae bacterium]